MNNFSAALWAETVKVRRSKVLIFTTLGFSISPLMAGLFMIILKDPEKARSMGLITAKAQLVAGVADWPTFFSIVAQAVAVGGAILFAIITAWTFGREFSDRTAKDLLSLRTSREVIVAAKFLVVTIWTIALSLYVFSLALVVGSLVSIPGWSQEVVRIGFIDAIGAAILSIGLLPLVALFASIGRGDLLPIGWTILTVVLAQIAALTGWGDWFPWSVPPLFSGAAGPRSNLIGLHSYGIVVMTALVGLAATFYWWRAVDQTR